MLSDPRIGLRISLAVAALSVLWLLAQWPFGDALQDLLDYAVFAADFLAIFLALSGLAVALLFVSYQRVKRDLLENRNVIARWHVDAPMFARFAEVTDARDDSDKRGALVLIVGLVIIIFGAFVVADPDVLVPMTAVGGALIIAVLIAYVLGGRARRKQLEPRSCEIIVGRDGVLVNDVLHVWGVPLCWFSHAQLESGAPAVLTLQYAFLARYGLQTVTVMAPVPPTAMKLAQKAVEALGRKRRGRPYTSTAHRISE